MTKKDRSRVWVRWTGEALIIVASVFIAIYLEGVADDSARSDDAHAAMVQLLSELRADQEDLRAVREQQLTLRDAYDDLLGWFAEPERLPGDSVQAALDEIAFLNRTMYPRRGTWRALTSSDQLTWVTDRSLVTRLANFYESTNARLEYAGRDYDFNVNDVLRGVATRAWDSYRLRSSAAGNDHLPELREQLRYLRLAWNEYYVDLLDDYGAELRTLIRDLETYLAATNT